MLIFLALIDGEENKNKFIELYEKYKNIVFAISLKIIKDYHLAEDATQIAFTKIAKNIEKVVSLNDLSQKSYISTIAKNTSLDLAKSERRFFTYDISKQYSLSENQSTENDYTTKEQYDEILKIIFEMDEKYKDVLTLYYLVGLSVKEIAIALGRSMNSVNTQLTRGKQLIIKKFKELNIKWHLRRQKY